jgi:predicted enzyme related to lactoylglutathione lyase
MVDSVVHVEIIGRDPERLREFYGQLFGWQFDLPSPVAGEVSDGEQYGFVNPVNGSGPVAAGVGGGPSFAPHAIFYVGVQDVAAALAEAARLGGSVVLPVSARPDGHLVVAQFADPEGTVVGLAGPAIPPSP